MFKCIFNSGVIIAFTDDIKKLIYSTDVVVEDDWVVMNDGSIAISMFIINCLSLLF